MLEDASKSVYEHVIYDSDTERRFAEEMERHEAVKLYAKLPGWFTVPTPLGTYNPDWAVLVTTEDGDKLYFVVETKASTSPENLRPTEHAKIKCGKQHFQALAEAHEPPAHYTVATNLDEVLNQRNGGTQ